MGLTVVALGTSLPELSITVIAALRRHAGVAVGNLLGIIGLTALIQPLPIEGRLLQFDQWIMLASAVLVGLFLYTGRRLTRIEGAGLLGIYVAYLLAGLHWFAN